MKRLLVYLALFCCVAEAHAQDDEQLVIEIFGAPEAAEPIAVVPFGWTGTPPPTDIASVISDNLTRTGLFDPSARAELPSEPTDIASINYRQWTSRGIPNLVIGNVQVGSDGIFTIQFQLVDVNNEKQALGQQYKVGGKGLRSIAHKISDEIYHHLTGQRGAFDTRIAYITETVSSANVARYALHVADSDGVNPQDAFSSPQPILSPAWSPDGLQLAYVSYENKQAQIVIQNVANGKRRLVAGFPGLNAAPAWSPDGRQLAMTLSKDGNPEIYVLDLGTNLFRRITRNVGIDTEPAWSPDGGTLVFTSDRSGRPQIYQIPSLGGRATRLTFEGKYNARASFSPDGSKLVMVHSGKKGFQIALFDFVNPDDLEVLTDAGLDESPSFAPNGSMILYATSGSRGAALAAISVDGKTKQRLKVTKGGVREPAWAPYRKSN